MVLPFLGLMQYLATLHDDAAGLEHVMGVNINETQCCVRLTVCTELGFPPLIAKLINELFSEAVIGPVSPLYERL